jgi:hypothetical protein
MPQSPRGGIETDDPSGPDRISLCFAPSSRRRTWGNNLAFSFYPLARSPMRLLLDAGRRFDSGGAPPGLFLRKG